MKKVDLCGMPALIGGEGEVLLFLHGFMSCKESFIHQLYFFERYFKVVAVDLPGFGESGETDKPYSLQNYVDAVKNVVDFLGGKVNIIAHSFGGRIAVKLCYLYPDCVNRLVLTGSAGLKPRRSIKYRLKKAEYKLFGRFYSQESKEKRFFSKDYQSLSDTQKKSFKLIVNEFLDEKLSFLSVKTFIVWGKNDKETPLYMAKRYNKKIKNSRLYVIDGGGHFCFIDEKERFNFTVKEFLKEKA